MKGLESPASSDVDQVWRDVWIACVFEGRQPTMEQVDGIPVQVVGVASATFKREMYEYWELLERMGEYMAIERIGFFHFGANHTDPIGSLKGAIADAGSVRNSLIVLPEGFNIGKFYKETERGCHYDLAILSDLHQLAKACAATFVAGLILKVSDNPDPPYSAAYIIDGTFEERLCYKMSDDSSGNYTPCRSDPGISNPLPHSNACVGGLICADILVLDGSAHERVRLLFERMNEFKSDLETIVCIPACMHRPDLDGEEGSSVFCYENWKGRRYILANTTAKGWNGTRSFITDRDDKKTHTFPDSVGDNQYINKICLAKL